MEKDIYILGIESSCDDTSAAVLRNGVLLSNVTASQDVHMAYGGVVPELASRAHQQNVVPVVDQAIRRAGITKEQLSAVAFTRGPGLMGSLLVGVSFAKGYAVEPGTQARFATEGVDGTPGFDEGILEHIIGIGVRLQYAAHQYVERLLVRLDHQREGLLAGAGVFEQLPLKQREVFTMRYFNETPYEERSELTKILKSDK